MKSDSKKIAPFKGKSGSWLAASLFLSLLVLPLYEGLPAGRVLLLVGYSLTLVLAAVRAQSKFRISALLFLAVSLVAGWGTLIVDSSELFVAHCLLGSMFFWVAGGVIVFTVVRTTAITIDSVFSAISAYLLFGLAWALSYSAIYSVTPGAFSLGEGQPLIDGSQLVYFSQLIYYSFVTMSTLGYGDITPQDRITRTLSWIQSVTGQFYVAVVIAWLVSALPRPQTLVQESDNA